jgi:hypothetical protein
VQDNKTYLYIDTWQSEAATIRSSGLYLTSKTLVPDGPHDLTALGGNFLLEVDNDTFNPLLLKYGSVETEEPLLMHIVSNITWAPHPNLPPAGLDIRRPVYLVGMRGLTVGIDFGMEVNRVRVHCPFGNVTFHNLYLENLAYGDRVTGAVAHGLSLVNPSNLWFFTVNR